MYAEIDNSGCKLNIHRVAGELHNKLILRSNNGESKTFHKMNCQISTPGVPAGEKAVGDTMKNLPL